MRKEFLGSISVLLAGAGLAMAQPEKTLPIPAADPLPLAQAPQPAAKPPVVAPPAKTPENILKDPKPPEPAGTQKMVPVDAGSCQPCGNGAARPTHPAPTAEDLRDCHVGPCNNMWANADYLLWWTRKGPLPFPIVTTSPNSSGGIIGSPGTTVLLGNSDLDYAERHGGRLGFGFWLDDNHVWGFELGGFFLEQKDLTFGVSSDATGNPLLAQPFMNPQGPQSPQTVNDAIQIAFPDFRAGNVTVSSSSLFWGAEAGFVRNLWDCPNCRVDFIAGFRYLDLTEDLNIARNSTELQGNDMVFLGSPVSIGSTLNRTDRFDTRNQFYAAQFGGKAQYRMGNWTMDVSAKVALGPNHETVNIQGITTLSAPALINTGLASSSAQGGILAVSSPIPGATGNISRHGTDWFAIAPEVGIQFGYDLTDNIKLQAGYNFLYLSDVVRPGDQVNQKVNPNFVPSSRTFGFAPNQSQPSPFFQQTDFWAQGINAGISFSF